MEATTNEMAHDTIDMRYGVKDWEAEFAKPELEAKLPPQIYWFGSATLNALNNISCAKSGYTGNSVAVRVRQWQAEPGYSDIKLIASHPAMFTDKNTGEPVYYMDHAVHRVARMHGLQKLYGSAFLKNAGEMSHVSHEFYVDPSKTLDFKQAADNFQAYIENNYHEGNPDELSYYTDMKLSPNARTVYSPTRELLEKEYQKKAVADAAKAFLRNKQVLLWSPTRTGKSIMAALITETVLDQKKNPTGNVIVVVTGKTDVFSEFEETFGSFKRFGEVNPKTKKKPFAVLRKSDLLSEKTIPNTFKGDKNTPGADNIVVILSLQDLAGGASKNSKGFSSKKEHEYLSGWISFVICDEAHFGMFATAETYKKALTLSNSDEALEDLNENSKELEAREFEGLNPKFGYLYLTATPFNIFENETIFKQGKNIVAVDPDDIAADEALWMENHSEMSPHPLEDWQSPYFGVPKPYFWAVNMGDLVHYAFMPKKEKGISYFSSEQIDAQRKILQAMFSATGTDKIPNFFSNEKFRESGAGRNMVFVFQRKKSCASAKQVLEDLMIPHPDKPGEMVRLGDVYNIYDLGAKKVPSAEEMKAIIANSDKRTITLTAGKMLQGVSVPKWDTIVMLCKGGSLISRIQAWGRVNTPMVRNLQATGEEGVLAGKENLKPTSHVIDFFPNTLYKVVREESRTLARVFNRRKNGHPDVSYYIEKGFRGAIFDVMDIEKGALTPTDIRKKYNKFHSTMGPLGAANSLEFEADKFSPESKNIVEHSLGLIGKAPSFSTTMGETEPKKWDTCRKCGVKLNQKGKRAGACENCQKIARLASDIVSSESTSKSQKKPQSNEMNDHQKALLEALNQREDLAGKSDEEKLKVYYLELDEAREAARKARDANEAVRFAFAMILIYVAISPKPYGSFEEVLNDLGKQNMEIMKNLGVSPEMVKVFKRENIGGEDIDDHVVNISNKYHGVNGEAEFSSIDDKVRELWDDVRRTRSNEVFTPLSLTRLAIERVGLDARDYSHGESGMPRATWNEEEDFTDDLNATAVDFWGRILGDPNGRVLDPCAKSGIFILELFRQGQYAIDVLVAEGADRALLEERLRNAIVAIPTSGVTYEIVRYLYRELGLNESNVLWSPHAPESWKKNWALNIHKARVAYHASREEKLREAKFPSKLSKRSHPAELLRTLKKSVDKMTVEDYDNRFCDFLKRTFELETPVNKTEINETLTGSKRDHDSVVFYAIVGNPPYQTETSAKTVTNVFQEFQMGSNLVGKKVCLIYPADRWLQQSGKGMKEFGYEQANSSHLMSVDYWPRSEQIFPGVEAGSISMTLVDNEANNEGSWKITRHENNGDVRESLQRVPGERIISFDPDMNAIPEIVEQSGHTSSALSGRICSRGFFGLESTFVEENKEKAIPCNGDFTNKPDEGEWVRAFINDKAGSSGRTMWFWIMQDSITQNTEFLSKWKVCISSANLTGLNGRSPMLLVTSPGSVYGRSRLGVGLFDTAEEARNFFRWFQTPLIRYLQASSGDLIASYAKNVLDLGDYSNANEMFADSPSVGKINERLLKLYNLEDKADYISQWVEEHLAPPMRDPFNGLTEDEKKLFI